MDIKQSTSKQTDSEKDAKEEKEYQELMDRSQKRRQAQHETYVQTLKTSVRESLGVVAQDALKIFETIEKMASKDEENRDYYTRSASVAPSSDQYNKIMGSGLFSLPGAPSDAARRDGDLTSSVIRSRLHNVLVDSECRALFEKGALTTSVIEAHMTKGVDDEVEKYRLSDPQFPKADSESYDKPRGQRYSGP